MPEPIEIYTGPDACQHCLGWKNIANSGDGESWKYWAELSAPTNIAVTLGIVYPVVCPTCLGTGRDIRETLGRIVREAWIAWAKEQPQTKDSWFSPWEELGEPFKEADRRIGMAVLDFLHAMAQEEQSE